MCGPWVVPPQPEFIFNFFFFFDGKMLFQSGLTMTNKGMHFSPVCFCVCVCTVVVRSKHQDLVVGNATLQE